MTESRPQRNLALITNQGEIMFLLIKFLIRSWRRHQAATQPLGH
jgi:hypothetical protein